VSVCVYVCVCVTSCIKQLAGKGDMEGVII
jgi:hypothetical protein